MKFLYQCHSVFIGYLTKSELRNIILGSRENYKLLQNYLTSQKKWCFLELKDDSKPLRLEIKFDTVPIIPKSVKILSIFESTITRALPIGLKKLKMNECKGNQDLPPNLEKLVLHNTIVNTLPNSLRELALYDCPKFPKQFPMNLESFIFDSNIKIPVDFEFPPSIVYLYFKDIFDEPISNAIKNCTMLKTLIFPYSFSQDINDILPKLTHLKILMIPGAEYIFTEFPLSLRTLECKSVSQLYHTKNNCIEKLKIQIPNEKLYLSNSVTCLEFTDDYSNKPLEFDDKCNVQKLKLNFSYNESINNLPKNLTNLEFGFFFNKPFTPLNMNSLTHLTFRWNFNHFIENYPPNLIYLEFGEYFNQKIPNLPPKLTYLRFGSHYNHSLEKIYNLQNLRTLIFGQDFNKLLILPTSLEYLKLGNKFRQPLYLLYLCNLQFLKIPKNNRKYNVPSQTEVQFY